MSRRPVPGREAHRGQEEVERAAGPDVRFDPHPASVLLHHAFHDRQADTSPIDRPFVLPAGSRKLNMRVPENH